MARYALQGVLRDGAGSVIASAKVTVYDADTTDTSTVYAAKSGGSAISGASLTTSTSGVFKCYIDDNDYVSGALFDITVSKTNYADQTYSDLKPF